MTYRNLRLRPLNLLLKRALHSRTLTRAALGLGALAPAFAFANPTGGQVVAGQAGISAPDADHTLISQASQSAIINWQQFSIGSDQFVQFIQPDSSAVVLNRVMGGNPSQILGNLSANGQVFLVNPHGVFFGQGASLDVQGLVATTLDIQDSDFLAGHYVFTKADGASDAGVVNQGALRAEGGYIVLAGDQVTNSGVIEAQAGTVVLAAGGKMTLTLADDALVGFSVNEATLAEVAGVENAGSIMADGGRVLMTAKVANALTAGVVNNSGLVTAHSIQDHNGTIILAAQGADISNSGTLDASATEAGVHGGTIVIRGNGHTEITSTGSVNAAGNNADGGFIELSGHTLGVRGNVNLGHGGSVLIDPLKLYLTAGSSSGNIITSGDYVGVQFIEGQLNAGNDVVLVASSLISAGHPNPPSIPGGSATSITATSGSGKFTLKTGTLQFHSVGSSGDTLKSLTGSNCNFGVCTPFSGAPAFATWQFTPSPGTINLSGVTINIAGGFTASAGTGDVQLGAVTAKNVKITASTVTTAKLIANGTSTAGIYIKTLPNTGNVSTITTNKLITTGGGNVVLSQSNSMTGGQGYIAVGGTISAAGTVTLTATDPNLAAAGNITINGNITGKSINIAGSAASGGDLSISGAVHATGGAGSGDITLSANANGPSSWGGNVRIVSAGGITADNGNINITAHGGKDSGGIIKVIGGNMNAAGSISVAATNVSGTSGAYVSFSDVTGKLVRITAQGAGATINTGKLAATGTSPGDNVELTLQTASGATATSGAISIGGTVKSSFGSVLLEAYDGKLSMTGGAGNASITAGTNINLSGHRLQLGSLHAGSSVTVTGYMTDVYGDSASINIASGGVIQGKRVSVQVNNDANASHGANITLNDVTASGGSVGSSALRIFGASGGTGNYSVNITTGNLTATVGGVRIQNAAPGGAFTVNGAIQAGGDVNINESNANTGGTVTLGAVTGKSVTIVDNANAGGLTVGALTANGVNSSDNVTVSLLNGTGGTASTGTIQINGAVKSSHGMVTLNAGKASLKLGASSASVNDIAAAQAVTLTAHDMLLGGISAGEQVALLAKTNTDARIKVAGGKTITGKSVIATISGSSAGGSISLNDVTATGNSTSGIISLGAAGLGHPVTITTGNLIANTGDITLYGNNGGGTVTVNGTVKTGGAITFQMSGAGTAQALGGITVSGAISAGKQVDIYEQGNFTGSNTLALGNVTAGSYVSVNVTRQNAGSAVLDIGNINAPSITVNEAATSASPAKITLGSLNAVNAAGRARVHVLVQGKNNVITTGAITAQGKTPDFTGSSSSSNTFQFTQRTGAGVELYGSGSGSDTIMVNGAINISAQAGNYTLSGAGSHALTGSGSTGQALLNVFVDGQPSNQGAIKVTGDITMSGAGFVDASLVAGKINVGGEVTLTATAVHSKQTLVNTASGNNLTTTSSASKGGEALFFARAGTGAGLSASIAGNINVQGPTADVALNGGNVKAGAITVTGTGVKSKRSETGTGSLGAVSFSSSRSAGFGVLTAHATGPASTATVTLGGDVNISGIGAANINVTGANISTRNITVNQAAGHYTAQGVQPGLASDSGTIGGYWGHGLLALKQGTLNGGMALVSLQARGLSPCGCSNATFAQTVTVNGNINVSAVGDGFVTLAGSTVSVTGGINGTATRATVANGKRDYTYTDSQSNVWDVAHTLSGSGGRMEVDIRGKEGSGSIGSNEIYSGDVMVGGAISLTGPVANVHIKSGDVTVADVSVTGTGENLSVKDVYTPSSSGAGYTVQRSGVLNGSMIELQATAAGGKLKAGNLAASGPLIAGMHLVASDITLGSLDASASSGTATSGDTRLSFNTVTLTGGNALVGVFELNGSGSGTTAGVADVSGNLNVTAATDAYLVVNMDVTGYTLVTAGEDIVSSPSTQLLDFIEYDSRPDRGNGAAGTFPPVNLVTSGLALFAGGNIAMGNASFTVGTGSVPGVDADSTAVALVAGQGLSAPTGAPNAALVAGGALTLGKFTLQGDYAYLEAGSYRLNGPISVPSQTLVQFVPLALDDSISIEPDTSTSETVTLDGGVLNLFPGATLLIGGSTTTGDVTIGTEGAITLTGGSNFLVDTTGTVTGLDNVLSTGLVVDLHAQVFQVPTASEIVTSNTTDEDKDKTPVVGGEIGEGDGGGDIVHDDSTASVCHG